MRCFTTRDTDLRLLLGSAGHSELLIAQAESFLLRAKEFPYSKNELYKPRIRDLVVLRSHLWLELAIVLNLNLYINAAC